MMRAAFIRHHLLLSSRDDGALDVVFDTHLSIGREPVARAAGLAVTGAGEAIPGAVAGADGGARGREPGRTFSGICLWRRSAAKARFLAGEGRCGRAAGRVCPWRRM